MGRKQLRGKAIQKVPPSLGTPGQDGQVRPPKGDGPNPRTPLSSQDRSPVITDFDSPPQLPGHLPSPDGPGSLGSCGLPVDNVRQSGAAERASSQEHTEPLEKVGLSLSVGAGQDVQRGFGDEGKRSITAEIDELDPLDLHSISAPSTMPMPNAKYAWAL